MPHVTIKHFPADFTDEQKRELADAITATILERFDTHEGAVSITLEPVTKADWHETVVVPEITGRADRLIKAPTYLEN